MYIKDISCISAQNTFNDQFDPLNPAVHNGPKFYAIEPDYMEYVPKALLRRMGRVVKLGIGAGLPLIQKHEDIDTIILGTANGGLDDCFKFLYQIIDYEEGTLTPTNFVQSTPGAIAGNLALMSKCNGYNSTHVNGALSFETAILDAKLLFADEQINKVLIGCAEEIADNNFNINNKLGFYKSEAINSDELLSSTTTGTVMGEGAFMFVVENSNDNALAEIVDIDQITYPSKEDLLEKLGAFLNRNQLSISDIDTLIVGRNGDVEGNHWYDLIEKETAEAQHIVFKHLCGEFETASGFALWSAIQLLQGKVLPESSKWNKVSKAAKNILIYNHYKGEQHSFMLIR